MRKLGGIIGFIVGFLMTFIVGDQIPWVRDQSDYIGNAVAIAVGIGGWLLGSRIAQWLTTHAHRRNVHA